MINERTYSLGHIEQTAAGTKVDRQILERSVYALGLLEALVRVGTPMRFKGGSSLLLLLEEPMRLSTDVDIVVPPETDIDGHLDDAAKIFPFKSAEEQLRKGRNGIVKRHFKFLYDSPASGKPHHILLDVLFEDDHYARTTVRPIANRLLVVDSPPAQIEMPTADCILGDKLTAFAPHTTGIPLGEGKDLEVAKQLYDIATLVDASERLADTAETFEAIALSEIGYRGLPIEPADVLVDSIEAATSVAARGRYGDEYPLYLGGIRGLSNHVFGERYSAEKAVRSACKVMYAAASILMGKKSLDRVDDPSAYLEANLGNTRFAKLSKLRKLDAVAFAYLAKTAELLG